MAPSDMLMAAPRYRLASSPTALEKIWVVSVCHPYGAQSLNGTPNSPALVTKTMMAPDRMPGAISGRVIVRVVRSSPAPVVRALSSSAGSIRRNEPMTKR